MTSTAPTAVSASLDRKSSPWLSGTAIVVYVALVRLVVYGLAGPNYGYFRDELYYLACGEHPAWGYVDQPPLIAWIAWLLQHTIGTSLWALRLLPALSGVATVVLTGLLARELGGRRWAMFLAALAALLAPVLLAFSHLFTMNAFDPVFWTAIAYFVVRIEKVGDERLWIPVGMLAGVTILNKYGIVFWLGGLVAGILVTPLRGSLGRRWFWVGAAVATLIALPNFLWQWRRQFPFLQLMHNIRMGNRDVVLPPLAYLKAQAEMIGYVAAVLVIGAVVYGFTKAGRSFRTLGVAFVVFLTELIVLHGKTYYASSVYPMMFAGGAVGIDYATRGRWMVWAKPVLAFGIAAVSCIYAPTIVPILSVPTFLAYEHRMGIEQAKFEHSQEGVLPQLYADMFGWEGMAQRVAAYYHTLSPEEQRRTAIFGNNYGDAGAIDFFGPKYGLPKSIGGHQNYWIWGPRDYTGESMIVLGEGHEQNMKTKCASYTIVGDAKDPLSRPDEWLPIYHCRGFKLNLQDAWPELKKWH
jgi:hypothetical protein